MSWLLYERLLSCCAWWSDKHHCASSGRTSSSPDCSCLRQQNPASFGQWRALFQYSSKNVRRIARIFTDREIPAIDRYRASHVEYADGRYLWWRYCWLWFKVWLATCKECEQSLQETHFRWEGMDSLLQDYIYFYLVLTPHKSTVQLSTVNSSWSHMFVLNMYLVLKYLLPIHKSTWQLSS